MLFKKLLIKIKNWFKSKFNKNSFYEAYSEVAASKVFYMSNDGEIRTPEIESSISTLLLLDENLDSTKDKITMEGFVSSATNETAILIIEWIRYKNSKLNYKPFLIDNRLDVFAMIINKFNPQLNVLEYIFSEGLKSLVNSDIYFNKVLFIEQLKLRADVMYQLSKMVSNKSYWYVGEGAKFLYLVCDDMDNIDIYRLCNDYINNINNYLDWSRIPNYKLENYK